jgi:hypothetical protein
MPAFSQSVGGGKKVISTFTVTIVSNIPTAMIYVDNSQIKGNMVVLAAGVHNFRVSAPGYVDYIQDINVTANMTINAQLQALSFPLTVYVNVKGALIFVDGEQISGNVANVMGGSHSITVTANGFQDYNATVNVNGPLTINAQLQAQSFPLTINVNVNGALIFVDGAQISGNVANVMGGSHSIRVTANGYQDYNATVNVNGPLTLNAQLQAQSFPLTINVNVKGALIFVDGAQISGNVANVMGGSHAIRVTANGYQDYNATVNVNGPLTLNAQLQASMATLNFVFPQSYLDPSNREAIGQVKIFVDGQFVNPKREVSGIQIAAGRHTVYISSGGLFVQAGNFDFSAGTSYTIELFMELRVRASQ